MADENDQRTAVVGPKQVPDLIERYRVRRDAWIAQADELARLRDEVRSAAEREAMEIVTTARRDVRQVIMEARRELLVLSAQVQAALGEVSGKPDPAALLNRRSSDARTDLHGPHMISAGESQTEVFVPEAAVKTMLDEARADMEALAEDAKTVPFQATILAAEPEAEEPPPSFFAPLPPPSVAFESLASLEPPPPPPVSPAASRMLLSSPFPSDAVAVPQTRPIRTFVALFVIAGGMILGGSYWWLRSRDASPGTVEARPKVSEAATKLASSTETPAPTAVPPAPVPANEAPRGRLSVVVEARRSSWIRTMTDGQSDSGRTYAAGETVRLDAEQAVSLRVGDAGAVYVSVNKGAPMPLGRDGQVITRQFVAERTPSTARASAAPNTPATAEGSAESIAAAIGKGSAAPSIPPLPPAPTPNGPAANPVPLVQPAVAASPNAPALEPPPSIARAIPAPAPAPAVPLPRTEAASAPAAAPPATAIIPQSNSTSAVVAAARQWLDAYHRQERSLMSSLSTDDMRLADERRADERFPATADVSRSLDKISVQIAADTAVLTAVMTESGPGGQRVSPISQVWVLSGGQWRVRQVRLVSEARLNQIFR